MDNAKGSARLLHLSLSHSRLVTGEVFDLHILLTAPLKPQAAASSPKHAILLYPDTPQDKALGMPAPPVLAPALCRLHHLRDQSVNLLFFFCKDCHDTSCHAVGGLANSREHTVGT